MDTIANAFLAVALHELAHLAAALAMGVRVHQVGMSWKGPFVRRESGTISQNLTITLAGPGINLLLAFVFLHINFGFALNNFVLGICNLLPFPSSDGSRALSLLTTMPKRFNFQRRLEQECGKGQRTGVFGDEWRDDEAA